MFTKYKYSFGDISCSAETIITIADPVLLKVH